MRRIAATSLGLLLSVLPARAQELKWQTGTNQPAATLGTPVASLGRPVPTQSTPAIHAKVNDSIVVRGQIGDMPSLAVPEPGLPHGYPPPGYYPPPPYYYPPPAYYPPPSQVYYSPPPTTPDYITANVATKGDPVRRTSFSSRKSTTSRYDGEGGGFHDWCENIKQCCTSEGRNAFESDHSLDCFFTSPVANPFLFEDPRSLTEVRPIFLWQTIPSSNPVFGGGDMYFYGLQARVAFTEWLSFTINKLGGVTINPEIGQDASGLAELHLGPKFTFYRNSESGTAAALGLIFQIPVGPSKVFQDTGDFSMVPYLSVAQNFGRSSYGSFNVMDTLGYSFSVGSGRSDFFYNSIHLDFDVANQHKFYPFLELNWFHYGSSGDSRPINQEGRDFANVGGTDINGRDYLSLAPGFRYKFTENTQFGLATEFPVSNPKDFQEFRLTLDCIFRY